MAIRECQWSGTQTRDRVDVRAGQDLMVVDAGGDPIAEAFPGVDSPSLVKIGNGDELDSRHLERRLGVDEADDAHPDRGDPDPIVGAPSTRLAELFRPGELEHAVSSRGRDHRGEGGAEGRRLEERPPCAQRSDLRHDPECSGDRA